MFAVCLDNDKKGRFSENGDRPFLWMFFGRKRMSLTASHVC